MSSFSPVCRLLCAIILLTVVVLPAFEGRRCVPMLTAIDSFKGYDTCIHKLSFRRLSPVHPHREFLTIADLSSHLKMVTYLQALLISCLMINFPVTSFHDWLFHFTLSLCLVFCDPSESTFILPDIDSFLNSSFVLSLKSMVVFTSERVCKCIFDCVLDRSLVTESTIILFCQFSHYHFPF